VAKKVLVPVFPSDRFYEAVVRAADILEDEGGLIVFAFTKVRPSPEAYFDEADGRPAELDVAVEAGDFDAKDLETWRAKQIAGLEEARQLLYDRNIRDGQVDYVFLDEADSEGTGQAIADEAAAGAYDAVVLSRGYFVNEVNEPGQEHTPEDVAQAVTALEGPALIVA
jgi:hypothetical protein